MKKSDSALTCTVNRWAVWWKGLDHRVSLLGLALFTLIWGLVGNPAEAETGSWKRVEVATVPVPKAVIEKAEIPSKKKATIEKAIWDRVALRWSSLRTNFLRTGHPCTRSQSIFEEASRASGVPAEVIAGVAMQESGRCGVVEGGWMQIGRVEKRPLKDAANYLGIPWSRFDPQQNGRQAVMAGAMVLRDLWARYGNGIDAILAYNLGPAGLEGRGGPAKSYGRLRSSLPVRVRDYLPNVLAGALWSRNAWNGAGHARTVGEEADQWLALQLGGS